MKKEPNMLETRMTFIRNLRDLNDDAWSLFYDNYSELILNFARKRGCSPELAQDVLQETAVALFKYLPNFEYDKNKGKFRSFLFKITESKVVDAFRRTKQINLLQHSEIFGTQSCSEDECKQILHLWDEAVDEAVLIKAINIAKDKVRPKTYECFENVFLKGLSVKNVAQKLGISSNLVSQHKHKVLNMIVDIAKIILKGNEYK